MTELAIVFRVMANPADVPQRVLPAHADEAKRRIEELERDKARLEFQLRLAMQQLAQRN